MMRKNLFHLMLFLLSAGALPTKGISGIRTSGDPIIMNVEFDCFSHDGGLSVMQGNFQRLTSDVYKGNVRFFGFSAPELPNVEMPATGTIEIWTNQYLFNGYAELKEMEIDILSNSGNIGISIESERPQAIIYLPDEDKTEIPLNCR